MPAAIMNGNGMSYHLREDRAGTTPGANNFLFAFVVHILYLLQQLWGYERPLLQRS
jgi:hypothetical protein